MGELRTTAHERVPFGLLWRGESERDDCYGSDCHRLYCPTCDEVREGSLRCVRCGSLRIAPSGEAYSVDQRFRAIMAEMGW